MLMLGWRQFLTRTIGLLSIPLRHRGTDLSGNYLTRLITDMYDTIEKKWTKYVVYFDRSDQARMFEELKEVLDLELPPLSTRIRIYLIVIFVAAAAILAAFLVMYALRKRKLSPVSIYASAMRDLVRTGSPGFRGSMARTEYRVHHGTRSWGE